MDKTLISRFNYYSEDYDEFGTMLKVAYVEEKLLEAGPFKGTVNIVSSPHVDLCHFEISNKVLQVGTGSPGYITFTIWDPSVSFNWRKHKMKQGMIGVLWNREHESVTGAGFEGLPLSIEENFFKNYCQKKGFPELISFLIKKEVLFIPEAHLIKIRQLVRFVAQTTDLENHIALEFLESKLLEILVDGLITAMPVKPAEDLTYPKFTKVIDYIHENLTDLTSVQQICENTKVPERTIRRLIRKKYELSPKNYLNNLRLNEVRKGLMKDSEFSNVMQAASDYNFWHMGQFTRDYKMLFGELPSETLRIGSAK